MMDNPWDQRFSRTDAYVYGEQPNAWIATHLPTLSQRASVLALADGEGRNAVWLAEQGYDVINMDYSAVGLEKTKQLALKRGVHVSTEQVDLIHSTLPESRFDAVVASFFHVPSRDQATLWHNVVRSLKPAGYLVVQVFAQKQLPLSSGGPKDPDLLYRRSDWQHFLTGMRIDILEAVTTVLDEGILHQGIAEVINIKSMKQE